MGKSSSKLKSKRSQSIAWSFRFPSATGLHQALGASRRRKKRGGHDGSVLVIPGSVSCRDLRQKRDSAAVGSTSSADVDDEFAYGTVQRCQSTVTLRAPPGPAAAAAAAEDTPAAAARRTSAGEAQQQQQQPACPEHGRPQAAHSSNGRPAMSQEDPEESVCKLLERELRLFDLIDPRDLRSYAWYHGSTLPGRKAAEAEIPNDGDFLVRDSTSQLGNYVLSVRHKGQALHFVINKLVLQPNTVYERVQYQFEEEAFDTVADLITFYVGSKRPISGASGARIVTPRQRRVALASGPALLGQYGGGGGATGSSSCSSCSSLPGTPRSPPHVPRKKERSLSLSAYQHYSSPPPPQLVAQLQASTLPRAPAQPHHQPLGCSLSLGRQRLVSDPALKFHQLQLQHQRQQQLQPHYQQHEPHYQSPRNNSAVRDQPEAYDTPPPKPPRVPRHLKPAPPYPTSSSSSSSSHQQQQQQQQQQPHAASGSDSGNGSGDSEFEAAGPNALPMQPAIKGIIIRSYHQAKALGLGDVDIKQWQELERRILETAPTCEIPSVLELDTFNTILLPPTLDHKPLDATALRGVTAMLYDTASRVLASHLTKIDVDMLLKVYVEEPPSVRDGRCGLELLILPYARQTRLDAIERTECLKLLVAVTVLTCCSPAERAATISRWIQVAIDTKTALGNLFGFCAIMLGLCLPQIQRLTDTWNVLRQKHTDEAFTFEAKLRPTLRAMNECTDPQAPNTTVPHILPIALLNERTHDDVLGNKPPSALAAAVLSPWENSAADGGLSIMWAHLETSRKMTENLTIFRRNAEIALEGCRSDELLHDAFRTEFHVRFLWGSRGAVVAANERHAKFVQVLDAMYERCLTTEQQA